MRRGQFDPHKYALHTLITIVILLLLVPVLQASQMRELEVGVAVTPSYKKEADWKSTFEQRLAYASKIFENEFGIALKPKVYWDWPVYDESADMDTLFADLTGRYPLRDVDIVIGLSGITEEAAANVLEDRHILGRARPFVGYLVLRKPINGLFKIQQETVLLHELGHLFGAVHTGAPKTIMAPIVDRQIPSRFDDVNREIIKITRAINFKNGADALDQNSARFLLNAYKQLIHEGQSYEFYYAMGNFYLRLGQTHNALTALKKAVQLEDKSGFLHHDIGVLYLKMQKNDEAITHLNRAIALFQNKPAYQAYRASAYQMLGRAYFEKGSYNAAQHNWLEALSMQPDHLDLRVSLAAIHLKEKRYLEAVNQLNTVLKAGGRGPRLYNGIAIAYYEMGDYKKAIEFFKKALSVPAEDSGALSSLDNTSPTEVYLHLGFAHMHLENWNEALVNFETACRMDQSSGCQLQLGKVYFQLKRWKDAVDALMPALKQERRNADLYGMVSTALIQMGDDENAERILKAAIRNVQNRQTQALFHSNLGNIYLKKHDADAALREFRFSVDKKWDHVSGHIGMALAYLGLDDVNNARQAIRQALVINPNEPQAKRIAEKIG